MVNQKVCVASSRPIIGDPCLAWASANLPGDWELTGNPEAANVFISVLYGHLVSEDFIAQRRCYNFHPGLLPAYRGAGAFSWAIINGDKQCGVTLHELDVDIDTGPIITTSVYAVEAWDTAETLCGKGMEQIYYMFRGWFARLLSGDYQAVPQSADGARTYYRKDLRAAADLTRFVRAFTFEGKEAAYYLDRKGNRHALIW